MTSGTGSQEGRKGNITSRLARLVSFLGCALSLQSTPVAAQVSSAVPPSRGSRSATPPWSGTSGTDIPLTRARVTSLPVRHPAIHPERAGAIQPQRLFPRVGDLQEQKRARAAAMDRHPAGKARTAAAAARDETCSRHAELGRGSGHGPGPCPDTHVVRPGESLWSIATPLADGAGATVVSDLTTRIYALNLDTIGDDPDLIRPGQKLEMPGECQGR